MNVVARSPTLRVLRVALLGATLALSCASDKERQLAASGGSGGAGRPGQTSGGTTAGGVTAGGTAAGGATAGASPTGGAGELPTAGSGALPAGGSDAQPAGGMAATGGSPGGGAAAGTAGDPGVGGGAAGAAGVDGQLALYFVDTEGGQATVIRFGNGQVMVVDTGNSGSRDGDRLQRLLTSELAATSVDFLLTTHFDGDHVGGVTYLAERTPVRQFLDHGDVGAPQSYLTLARAGTRRQLAAGDQLMIGTALLDIVSSNAAVIQTPLPGGGAANPHCAGALNKDERDENSNSIGFVLRFGSFDFLNLADLLWNLEHELACPTNRLGVVDLYLTTHHGLTRSGAPQLVRAVEPLAAIMNNGPRKGGGGTTWDTLALAPGGGEVWQLHRAVNADAAHNAPEDQIANLEEGAGDLAFWLKVVVEASGRFTIHNPRTSRSKTYQAR